MSTTAANKTINLDHALAIIGGLLELGGYEEVDHPSSTNATGAMIEKRGYYTRPPFLIEFTEVAVRGGRMILAHVDPSGNGYASENCILTGRKLSLVEEEVRPANEVLLLESDALLQTAGLKMGLYRLGFVEGEGFNPALHTADSLYVYDAYMENFLEVSPVDRDRFKSVRGWDGPVAGPRSLEQWEPLAGANP